LTTPSPRTWILALTVILVGAASVPAAPILSVFGDGTRDAAVAAEALYLAGLTSFVTEDFEAGFVAGDRSPFFATAVGTFTGVTPGNPDIGAACGTQCLDGLAILSRNTTPYGGRFAYEDAPGDPDADARWLDSNDYKKMTWEANDSYDSVGFFMTDPNDVGALVSITSFDADDIAVDLGSLFAPERPNGQIYYVTIEDAAGISRLDFYSDPGSERNDGYGIDRFTAARVPEPGTLVLLGAGLVAFATRKRSRRP
jgi:hypothetical protein